MVKKNNKAWCIQNITKWWFSTNPVHFRGAERRSEFVNLLVTIYVIGLIKYLLVIKVVHVHSKCWMCVVDVFIVPTCDISEPRWVSIIGWRQLCAQGEVLGEEEGLGRKSGVFTLNTLPIHIHSWELEEVCTGTFHLFVSVKWSIKYNSHYFEFYWRLSICAHRSRG